MPQMVLPLILFVLTCLRHFDKVNFYGLVVKLMNRNVPKFLVVVFSSLYCLFVCGYLIWRNKEIYNTAKTVTSVPP